MKMSVLWNLRRELLVRKNLHRPIDFQALLSDHGLPLALPAVCSLVNGTPRALRLTTMQAICNALDCQLSDFCVVAPDAAAHRAVSSKNRKASAEDDLVQFPDPFQYRIHELD